MEQKSIDWEAYKNPEERLRLFREQFAEYLEDIVTDPTLKNMNFSTNLPEDVRCGISIPWSVMLRDAAYRITQDMRFTHDQADEAVHAVFEAEKTTS